MELANDRSSDEGETAAVPARAPAPALANPLAPLAGMALFVSEATPPCGRIKAAQARVATVAAV